jgi:hypothetical protein
MDAGGDGSIELLLGLVDAPKGVVRARGLWR